MLFRIARAGVLAVVIVVLALSLPASAAYPMRVKDARGKEILIKHKPMRIVSLTPNNTEILFSIGLRDRIVGVTSYCDYPAEAKKKTKIGDATVSTETVVALKPDLIVAHSFMNDAAIPRLEKLGFTVFAIDPKTISEVARDIRTIGKITARPKTADSVAKGMEQSISKARSTRSGKPTRDILAVIQANPLWVAGPKTFLDEMMRITRATNVAFDASPGFVTFSCEAAIRRNPDVILVGRQEDATYFRSSSVWKKTNAVKSGRVYVIDHDLLVRPGPRLGQGLQQLASKLNQ